MNREEKVQLVNELRQVLTEAKLVVVTHNNGLSVKEMTELRNEMRGAEVSFKIVKNRLLSLAVVGTHFEGLKDLFSGPTALAYSQDPIAAAKVAMDFSKRTDGKLVIRGGAYIEQRMEVDQLKALASLPSLDELRAKLIGVLSAPATRIASILKEPGAGLARVLAARQN